MKSWFVTWTEVSWLDWGLNVGLKSTLLLLAALVLVRFYQLLAARYRYLVWKGIFALLLLIPLAGLLPSVVFESNTPYQDSRQFIEELPIPYKLAFPDHPGERTIASHQAPSSVAAESISFPPLDITFWIAGIWAIGSLALLLPLFLELLYFQKLLRQPSRSLPEDWQFLLRASRRQMQVDQPIRIVFSKALKMPLVFGWKKAYVLIPEEALNWEQEKIKTVLLHELGHIRQKDFKTNLFVQFIKAFYWWHPLVWWAEKKIRLECEHSCDELVVRAGFPQFDYARHLVEIARSIHRTPLRPSLTTIPIAHNSQLKRRVDHILRKANDPLSRRYLAPLRFLAIFALPVLFMNLNSIQQSEQALIRQLSHPDGATQVAAAKRLGELQSESAFAPLVGSLKSEDPQVRAAAAWALGQIQNKAAIAELLPLVYDKNDCVKEWALLSLGEFGAPKAFYSIVKTQSHRNPEIRKATLWSLHQIGCLPAFHHICQHLEDDEEEVRSLAQRMLETFPREKLRNWMARAKHKTGIRQWVFDHYVGILHLGMEDLLVDCLGKDKREKALLENIVAEPSSIEALDEIWELF